MESILGWLIVGALAGWLAGKIMKGSGFGLIANIAIGIAGAVIGGWIFRMLGTLPSGLAGSLVTATLGAIILLGVARWLRR